MITKKELREKYINFFVEKSHGAINGASLIPENDPTVLFTTAGMHPLVPFFLGEKHPSGNRLVNFQKCIRTGDIEEVGDDWHLTFFEMLGNWSLGDYFKEESIAMSYEFLTDKKWLGLSPDKLAFTVFAGDENAPTDTESEKFWMSHGIPKERIFHLGKEDNWWGPAGQTGPCGPCTEIFFIADKQKCSDECSPACNCGKYVEIWNNVFLEFDKAADASLSKLKQHNVDTGLGVERVVSVLNGAKSVYETEFFEAAIKKITELSKAPVDSKSVPLRIIADHIKTATFAICDGALPSNLGAGYVVRRLIRRAIRYAHKLEIKDGFIPELCSVYIEQYAYVFPELKEKQDEIIKAFVDESAKFEKTLQQGLKEFNKVVFGMKKGKNRTISGRVAFKLYDTYGFPLEITMELANEEGFEVDKDGYAKAFEKHQELSRAGSEKLFKGGMADNSEMTTSLHTATHLLHEALRRVLGDHVEQKGSNITPERLRFDFSHPQKVTREELDKVEALVNEQIKADHEITMIETTFEDAREQGAIGLFANKYGEKVKVYSIGDFSKEICGGPHVEKTSKLGSFKIKKEQASSAGIRRIKAVVKI
jgi:alanyl-tRNA synthetase